MYLNNKPFISRPTFVDSNFIEINFYSFMISLGRCNGKCNTVDDSSAKISAPNKTIVVNVKLFNMITRIKESKALLKQISCVCKCKFDSKKCNSNKKWNDNRFVNGNYVCKQNYIWVLSICTCEIGT